MDQPRNRAILMRRALFTRSLSSMVLMLVSVTATVSGQDLARTIDAEVRVALFELMSGSDVAALSRLERLTAALGRDSSGGAAAEKSSLHFLLAQSYFRLGMMSPFRREAEAALSAGQSRYASVLRPQLVVEAYRSGDFARAATLARDVSATDATGLPALVSGLAAYQVGDLTTARASFQRAAGTTGQYASYAKYMDAIAQLRADTTHAEAAIASFEAVASTATGSFADQVRLTAAQVAYEGDRYADAVRIAGTITDSSRVAAPALLTRAWALYKLDRVDEAERAFSDFATRYPARPERDEAHLMAAQAQLELGRSGDAERIFQRVADSSAAEVTALQSETNTAIAELARAIVTARATDVLAGGDPAETKSIAVADSVGVVDAFSAITGTAPAALTSAPPHLAVGTRRIDSLVARGNPRAVRLMFGPASATDRPRELAERSQALLGADAAVAVARHRLDEQVVAQERELALLTRVSASLASDSGAIAGLAAQHQALSDSLARLDRLMAAAEAKLRELLGRELDATRTLAAENSRIADSLRAAFAGAASAEDRETIDAEVATAAAYSRIAEIAASGLDKAIAHHPAFVTRDSLRAHDARAKTMLAELQSSYSGSRRNIDAAVAALRAGEGPAARAARQALADAESRRTSVEGEAIAAASAELSARAAEMIAGLQKNTEAAQFGTASAAFFRAIDGTRTVGDAGGATPGNATVGNTPARAGSPPRNAPDRRR